MKAFYGLSALLRQFPVAQHSFLTHGGLDVLKQVLDRDGSGGGDAGGVYAAEAGHLYGRLRIKILTLLQDLLGMFRRYCTVYTFFVFLPIPQEQFSIILSFCAVAVHRYRTVPPPPTHSPPPLDYRYIMNYQ